MYMLTYLYTIDSITQQIAMSILILICPFSTDGKRWSGPWISTAVDVFDDLWNRVMWIEFENMKTVWWLRCSVRSNER